MNDLYLHDAVHSCAFNNTKTSPRSPAALSPVRHYYGTTVGVHAANYYSDCLHARSVAKHKSNLCVCAAIGMKLAHPLTHIRTVGTVLTQYQGHLHTKPHQHRVENE